jgi:O-antigen/teichoic acid export membrane protein
MSVEVTGTEGTAGGEVHAKDTGKSAGKVGISIIVAMALGYGFIVVSANFLKIDSAHDAAVFLIFWGLIQGLGSAISPLEQELSRQSAIAALTGGRVGKPALRAIMVCFIAVAVAGLLAMIPAVSTKLFDGDFVLSVIVLIGGLSFVCQFATRGLLIGQHQIKNYSWLIIAEAAARILVLGVLAVAGVAHLVPVALAAAAGSFAWLLFSRPTAKLIDPSIEGESWRPISGRVLLLMLAAGLQASVITGYSPVVKLLTPATDSVRIAALFSLLQLSRVPLLLMAPLQALAVPLVVRLSTSESGRRQLRKVIAGGTVGSLVLAAVGAFVGLLIGPWAVTLLFKFHVEGWWAAGLVWSSVLIIPIQLMGAVLVARKQANRLLVTWAVVAVSTALVLLFLPGDSILRAIMALIVGTGLGLVVVLVFVLRRVPTAASADQPETPR